MVDTHLPRIDPDRLWRRLMALAEIGALSGGGVDRQALSEGEIDAWRLVVGWAESEGLEPSCDAAGNLFLTLPGADRTLPPVIAGSHLDTQPTGGKYDGAAGVLAAFEAAVTLKAAGLPRRRDLAVVAWMNEEGSRFAPGMMGSEVFAGVRGLDDIRAVKDARGVSVASALDALHAAFPELAPRPPGFPAAAYLELHIEQGPLLEAAGRVVGVVTGIQGKKTWEVVLEGTPGHAGTLPMAERRDALAAFTRMAHRLYPEIGGHDGAVMFTIGRLMVEPNAPSVVPARVTFRVDLRHPRGADLDRLGERFEAICAAEAAPCGLTLTRLVDAPPNDFDAGLMARIAAAATRRGVASMPILSAAGHDARHLAKVCPSAMIFIPCRDGVSHAENEHAEPAHLAAGTQVLADALAGLLAAQDLATLDLAAQDLAAQELAP
ncbi:Zn-dependent hydrolase [Xanthobacter dioxanivorans]|uniref:Zn-dependent hydrolase n=1 Tax=Xanthobacter dioxanivorans TaxID=2528964 RepID=A0A974PJ71_9HYPH|nr:Zn-dependent hydrolase [Xanthobacter dioxanivorans]QRG04622.1 Zn-dependent hydrolase [Xanthobacter dioxanivorans]